FDGRVWTAGERQRLLLRREATGEFAIAAPRGTGPIVRQEIFLDPIGTDAVFVAPRALRVELRGGALGLDDMGSVTVPTPSARLQYTVDSELEMSPPRRLRVLRCLAGRDAAQPGHSRASGRRFSARRVESLRTLLHGAPQGRALLGRGLLRRRGLGLPRSIPARRAGERAVRTESLRPP